MKKAVYKKSFDNQEVVAFECTECEWQGLQNEKKKFQKTPDDWITDVCPRCGNEDFYGITQFK